jgi:hypothetical protein
MTQKTPTLGEVAAEYVQEKLREEFASQRLMSVLPVRPVGPGIFREKPWLLGPITDADTAASRETDPDGRTPTPSTGATAPTSPGLERSGRSETAEPCEGQAELRAPSPDETSPKKTSMSELHPAARRVLEVLRDLIIDDAEHVYNIDFNDGAPLEEALAEWMVDGAPLPDG